MVRSVIRGGRLGLLGLLAMAVLLAGCGKGSQNPPELPLSTFVVDTGIQPRLIEIPGVDGGPARQVVALQDENGTQTEFVVDELVLVTDDEAQLQQFLTRWQGEVVDEVDPTALGLAGMSASYLVRVTAPAADVEKLGAALKRAVPGARSDLKLSSQAALDLFALFVDQADGGLKVSPNWVSLPQGLEGGPNNEGATGTSNVRPGGVAPTYQPDANTWPYMRSGGAMDIGVVAAWRTLSLANRLGNRIGVAILDGGFLDNQDIGGAVVYGGFGVENPALCSGNPCPWHGTGSAAAAFASVGNGYGAAGPGGPVANRILVQSPSDIWTVLTYPIKLGGALSSARIINISASLVLPATAAALAEGPLALLSAGLRAAGYLVVAAAGNDNLNMDDRDCFIACWYKRSAFPCELGNVLCVGATDYADRNRAPFSNYGRLIDIYGPGYVWVPNPEDLANASLVSGTSLASPFVAGVAALVWAANPSLSPGQVEEILVQTAHTSNGPNVGRVVNAARAVKTAVGNAPPVIRVRPGPLEVGLRLPVTLFSRSQQPTGAAFFSVYDEDMDSNVATVEVRVVSDRDGLIYWDGHIYEGVGDGFKTPGPRTLTVTATDPAGASSTAVLTVNVVNTPPTVTNITAPATIGLAEGWAPVKPVIAVDPNEPGGRLPCSRVTWLVQGNDLLQSGTGCDNFVVFSEMGTRTVTIIATDPEGASAMEVLTVEVGPRPAQIPPSVSGFVVRDQDGKELEDRTNVIATQCPLRATATIYNPDDMAVNLSWVLDDGTRLVDNISYPTPPDWSVIEISCAGLEYSRMHFISLFVGSGTAKKVFAFRAPPVPGPR